jgi:hypothetical protein
VEAAAANRFGYACYSPPTILGKITDTVAIQRLSDEDAVLLRDRLNAGSFH